MKSNEQLKRARRVLAGGVNSNIRLAEKPAPLVVVRGRGAVIEDADGRTYIDYMLGMGPVILGHSDPRVTQAIVDAVHEGLLLGGHHPLEAEVAERVCAAVASVEVVRFASSGSEAVHAAVRVARAATARWKVVRFEGHYHGWLDTVYVAERTAAEGPVSPASPATPGQPLGAVEDLLVLPWNDLRAIESAAYRYRGQIAAIILEPILCNTGVIAPAPGVLEAIRAWCDREGAVLIFDEVITGFRVAFGGAQSLLGVTPDLTIFGKALANGFPLSAVGGRRELMDQLASGRVMHGGTYNGNPPAMAAARATLDALAADGQAAYRTLTSAGSALMEGLRRIGTAMGIPVLLQGPGPVFQMWITSLPQITEPRTARTAGAAAYSLFGQAMLRRGVRLIPGGRWYVSTAHTAEHVGRTLDAAREALAEVRTGTADAGTP